MVQMGFMDAYERDDMKYYYFAIDSLTDFLIARSLFEDISGKDYHDKVVIIKSKMDALYSIHEALIIAIFDNMMPDYEQIINLLEDTGLIEHLDFRNLVKVHYKRSDIGALQGIVSGRIKPADFGR